MKNIVFSKHALYQMKQRRLNPDLINETILLPDKTMEDEEGLLVLQKLVKENNKYYL